MKWVSNMGAMTMTSLTIDTKVLMPPAKADDLDQFKQGILNLWDLEEDESVTVNYMNHIPGNLGFMKKTVKNGVEMYYIDEDKIKNELLELDPSGEFGLDNWFFEDYINKLMAIRPKPLHSKGKNKKGKLGVYENIPERNRDPGEEFSALGVDPGMYSDKKEQVHFAVFCNYFGYLAYLNDKYGSGRENYMVLGAENRALDAQPVNVKTAKENREAPVNVVGILKAPNVCRRAEEKEFKSLLPVLEEAKERFCGQLVFGRDVNHNSLTDGLNNLTEKESKKVFLYLETLNEVVKIINGMNLNNEIANDKNIIEMLNAHGLLCSPEAEDTMKYGFRKYRCVQRTLDNGMGKKILFDFHLKPLTGRKSDHTFDPEHTVRIYFVWNNSLKKISIGWMGRHLTECGKNKKDGVYTESDCPFTGCGNNPLSASHKKNVSKTVGFASGQETGVEELK
jgi:hypothetical protein